MRRKIVICDDDPLLRQQLCTYLNQFQNEWNESFSILQFSSGEALLENIPDEMQVLFLDIKMGETSGMEVARRLRTKSNPVLVYFITSMPEYAIDGYDVHAFAFLTKPLQYDVVRNKLREGLQRIDKRAGYFITIHHESKIDVINISEILYIEVYGHSVYVQTKDGVKQCTASLKDLEATLLQRGFFRCHKSYLVNLRAITQVEMTSLTLFNGTEVPLSKHRRKNFLNALSDFSGGSYGA